MNGRTLLAGLALLAAAVACQTPGASTPPAPTAVSLASVTPAGTAQALAVASATAVLSATAAPTLAPTAAVLVLGPGDFVYPDPRAGLADLTSYQATLTMAFDGTAAGAAQRWTKTYVMSVSQVPAARQLTIIKGGDLDDLDPVYLAEAAGVVYDRHPVPDGAVCDAQVIDPNDTLSDQLEPAGLLEGVIGAEDAGSETVNGVAAEHYTFDERAFGLLGLATMTGELWVATPGDYLVKYTLTTQADANYFGEDQAGTLTEDYELEDVNQLVAVALPPDCPPGLINAPQLPDASNVQNVPGLLSYDTASSLADVVAFYQAQLPALGWAAVYEPEFTDTTALLAFTQGDQKLTLIASTDGTVTSVLLDLSPIPPSGLPD